jgi:hypothetical protein
MALSKFILGQNFDRAFNKLLELLKDSGLDSKYLDVQNLREYVRTGWLRGEKGGGFYIGNTDIVKIFAYDQHDGEYVAVLSIFPDGRKRNSALTKKFNDEIAAAL